MMNRSSCPLGIACVRVTLNQIAKQTGVSVSTVSRALAGSTLVNVETQKRILEAYRRLYRQTSVSGDSATHESQRLLGLCMRLPETRRRRPPDDPFIRRVQVMQQVASDFGYGVMLGPYSTEGGTPADRMIEARQLAGVILLNSSVEDPIFERLDRAGIPFIQIHRLLEHGRHHFIGVDDRRATRQMTEYLLDKGCRALAFVGGPPDRLPQQRKREGFMEAMRQRGFEPNPQWMVHLTGEVTREEAEKVVQPILGTEPRPTGVIAATDEIAFGVIQYAQRLGLNVPDDLRVAGFDDHDAAATFSPPLTTMHVPWMDMVRLATMLLVQLVEHGGEVEQIQARFATRLIVRRSA